MKKLVVLGMGLCVALAFSSCKSSESAYKKAYEKAKQQELAEAPADQVEATPVEAAPVVSAPVTTAPVAGPVREEKVELVSGDGLKAYCCNAAKDASPVSRLAERCPPRNCRPSGKSLEWPSVSRRLRHPFPGRHKPSARPWCG